MVFRFLLSKKHHVLKLCVLGVALCFIAGGIGVLYVATLKIPDLASFGQRKVTQSTKIYDRTGNILLYDVHQDIKRTIVPFSDISRNIKNAAVAIEDAEFYTHHGIRPISFIRAALTNFLSGSYTQGGSTITQQVVKNSILTTEKAISRKIKELVFAVKLEQVMTKEEILGLYLNESPFGGNIYGVEEASKNFFGKKASDVTLAEAAYLAALLQAPTFYSPYGNNKTGLDDRKNLVLSEMLKNNFITKAEKETAQKEVVTFLPREQFGIKAPHFVFYVKDYLVSKYGEQAVDEGGLKVITTLDYAMELKAETLAKKYALENKDKYNAENAAIVALNPKNGDILTMVGSRDYFDKKIQGNYNIATAKRQPGSTFKPFVYAEAFIKGYTPDTVVFDLPTEFQASCDGSGKPRNPTGDPNKCYMPENYDHEYKGPISLRDSIAQSRNVPSVKVFYLAGLQDSLHLAQNMGISTLSNIDQYGLTLVLGGGEVSLLEMTSAYGVFANDGKRVPYNAILEVDDSHGTILEKSEYHESTVLEPQIARTISDVLSDDKARIPAFGAHSALFVDGKNVAVKTGTTNDYKDAWIIGYTPSLVVGAWAGNNSNVSMEKKVAGFIIAPLWNAFISDALKDKPNEKFPKPEPYLKDVKPVIRGEWRGGETYAVDKISGKLATEYTPSEFLEERVITNVHDILYWVDKKNPLGPVPLHPENDSQFENWEYPIAKWMEDNHIKNQDSNVIPKEYDDIHTPENAPHISVTSPNQQSTFSPNDKVTVSLTTQGRFPISRLDVYFNGQFIGTTNKLPLSLSFSLKDAGVLNKENEIKSVVYDSVFNKTEATTTIYVNGN